MAYSLKKELVGKPYSFLLKEDRVMKQRGLPLKSGIVSNVHNALNINL